MQRSEKHCYSITLYTAQRRSDVVKMGRQHIKGDMLTVKQVKTGKPLAIPVHADVQAVLDATASEHLTFLVTATGKPYGGNAFSEQFRNWCDAAGCRSAANHTGCARPPVVGSRKPDAVATRSWRSADTSR